MYTESICNVNRLTSPVFDLFLFAVFISAIPHPRTRWYEEWLILTIVYSVGTILVIARFLKPVFDLLKVDIQSKVVSGGIILSTVAPRIGGYALSRGFGIGRIGYVFDRNIGDEMVRFRRDLRKMYVTNSEVAVASPQKAELLADIKRTHSKIRRRHAIGEILIGVGVGILALLVGSISFLAGVGLLLSLYLLMFPLSMALRRVVVDKLAYPVEMVDVEAEEIRYPPRIATLGFMQGWNRMLLQNEAVIHKLILVSFIKGEFILGYERGEELIERVLTGDVELEEAFDELVEEELGEDTTESRWFRRFVERFIGI
ncbi:hypothetical protein [Haloferax profundi]|uniref:hypothetical protein n=1 Tax=Haloferax profundi TaxID=1544718 RepID=UPI0012FC76E6|nr:hypothetical protein [Haloferax profundi]